jgi:crossover junction endodeoxyribonuclease RuvC
MRILGLDPGVARTGYGVVDVVPGKCIHRTNGCITTKAGMPHPDRLALLAVSLRKLLRREQVDLAAVERLFFTRNTSTAMSVGEARGATLAVLAEAGIPIVEYTPSAVKSAVTGSGRAGKSQVQRMVMVLLKLKKFPSPDDAADALAVALTAAAHIRIKR